MEGGLGSWGSGNFVGGGLDPPAHHVASGSVCSERRDALLPAKTRRFCMLETLLFVISSN